MQFIDILRRLLSTLTVLLFSVTVLVSASFAEVSPVSPSVFLPVSQLPLIQQDDLRAALQTFQRSCDKYASLKPDAVLAPSYTGPRPPVDRSKLLRACVANNDVLRGSSGQSDALAFLDQYFVAEKLQPDASGAMMTSYYEPSFPIAYSATERLNWPVYSMPSGLGSRPWFSRAEIEGGQADAALRDHILFYTDRWSAFVLQVQGSGIGQTADGAQVNVIFSGKNNWPYASIGKVLVKRGEIALADISMQRIGDWLADKPRAEQDAVYWQNPSFIFFRIDPIRPGQVRVGPPGAMNLSAGLTPGRSIAVDWAQHVPGMPLFLSGRLGNGVAINRLVVAQDRGSAINSRVRIDLFSGSGSEAADIAGKTRDDKLQLWALHLR